jgi:hypothetical protein
MSEQLKLLFAVDNLSKQHPTSKTPLANWAKRQHKLIKFAESLGLTHGLSLEDLGSSLPAPLTEDALRLRYRVRLARQEGQSVPSLLRGVVDRTWQLAAESARGDIDLQINDQEVMVLANQDGVSPDPNTVSDDPRPYINCGDWNEYLDAACASTYADYLVQIPTFESKSKISERVLTRTIRRFKASLPALPKNVDLTVLPPLQTHTVWIRRTIGPTGELLYPRWDRRDRASEARLRAEFIDKVWVAPHQPLPDLSGGFW